MEWRQQKMKVNLAAQVSSSIVANALQYCSENFQIPQFEGSVATVKFIRIFDHLFDIFNFRNPFAKGFKSVLLDTYTVNGQTMSITDAAIIRKYDLMDHVPLQDDHEYADSPTITSISEFKKASISYISGYVVKMAEKENQMHGLLSNTETGKHTEEASFLKFKDRGGQNESFTETLLALTNEPELLTIDSLHMQSLERFVVIMYSKGCGLAKVNEARHRLFTSGKKTLENTQAALFEHIKRALLQGSFYWNQATVVRQEIPDFSKWGWQKEDNGIWRWKQVQYLTNLFWRRWLNEYLLLLQRRQKGVARQENLKIGDIVLMADNRLPRGQWPLGRVIEVYPDKGADVRTLKVKSKLGIMDRPVSKLVNLESHL
ncbi:DNA transposase THAP9 [Nymphon striatum]|nr:DNA transposase THAP9 [Nymphon striatum]